MRLNHVLVAALASSLACSGESSVEDVVSVSVAPEHARVIRGGRQAFKAEALLSDGSRRDVTGQAQWTASDEAVAGVIDGTAAGRRGGETRITATWRGVSGEATIAVIGTRVAFATSASGPGDLGAWPDSGGVAGLAGADAVCERMARQAGLPGTFRAWLSDSHDDAYCRVHGLGGKKAARCGLDALPASAGPWIRTDMQPLVEGLEALVARGPLVPLRYDEAGRELPPGRVAWTGTGPDGTLDSDPFADRNVPCHDWSASGFIEALAGATEGTLSRWTVSQWQSCLAPSALLCFEVGEGVGAPLPVVAPAQGLKAFVTGGAGSGELGAWLEAGGLSGLDAGDAICRAYAGWAGLPNAERFKAWLSDSTTDAVDRFAADGPWVRVDGLPVAASRADLAAGRLFTSISLDALGNIGPEGVWTGTGSGGRWGGADCGGWRDASLTGDSGASSMTGVRWTDGMAPLTGFDPACQSLFALYCLEDVGAAP